MKAAIDDRIGPAPETRSVRFVWLLFGISAAPLFWLGQMMLGYGVTAAICYPGDHPVGLAAAGPLFAALMVFDLVALGACAAGGFVALRAWRQAGGGPHRLLAFWGLVSSLWFAAAILFGAIASLVVPPCLF